MTENETRGLEPAGRAWPGFAVSVLLRVFAAPGKFFEQLRDHPRVIVPYIALIAVGMAGVYATVDLLAQEIGPDPAGRIPSIEESKRLILTRAPIGFALIPLVVAGSLAFWGNLVFGGKATFKQILSVSLYSELVFAVVLMFQLFTAAAKGSLEVSFSLGMLAMDQGMDSIPFVALSKISLQHLWQVVVLGIAAAHLYQIDRNKGYRISVLTIGTTALVHIATKAI
jgi:hypothetical protein